jgi:hypothetical protein
MADSSSSPCAFRKTSFLAERVLCVYDLWYRSWSWPSLGAGSTLFGTITAAPQVTSTEQAASYPRSHRHSSRHLLLGMQRV